MRIGEGCVNNVRWRWLKQTDNRYLPGQLAMIKFEYERRRKARDVEEKSGNKKYLQEFESE